MRYAIIILLWSIAILNQSALTAQNLDTNRTFFPKSYGTKKWRPLIGFDAYRSFYSGAPVKFNGIRFGAEFIGVHRFGFGFYGLKKDLVFSDLTVSSPHATDTSQVKFQLNYSAFFYERVFYKTKRWEISIPLYLGGGALNGFVEGSDGIFYKYLATSFSLLNTGINAKYYLFSWLAPRIGSGFRFTFNTEKNLRKAFNGPYYTFGISILVGELYKAVFKDNS
jgi:hypothetical protein